ncbi:hypothetical protein [Burkholderia sp. ABCPW 14]|uniref:hypothetical protein n=1 Tax=Burkholderia sp. ABCPW 14 TaxID=1637860 RepID=UPI00082F5ED5|nr:hypothetical protein [Burkholderia sp. ABCPW 14]
MNALGARIMHHGHHGIDQDALGRGEAGCEARLCLARPERPVFNRIEIVCKHLGRRRRHCVARIQEAIDVEFDKPLSRYGIGSQIHFS